MDFTVGVKLVTNKYGCFYIGLQNRFLMHDLWDEPFIYIEPEVWQFMVINIFKCILEKKKKNVLPNLTKVFFLSLIDPKSC